MKTLVDSCQLIALHRFLGKKWTIPLLHNIGEEPVSFNDLTRLTHHLINPTLLSNRLKEFVSFRIVKKGSKGGRIGYCLTAEGIGLKRLLHNIKHWSIDAGYSLPEQCGKNRCYCDELFLTHGEKASGCKSCSRC